MSVLEKEKKEAIAREVIRVLKIRFDTFPDDTTENRNAPFHERFLKAFEDKLKDVNLETPRLISLSSWLHGLNTTLGQSFFEKVAHILSEGEKRTFSKKSGNKLEIPSELHDRVYEIYEGLSTRKREPNLKEEEEEIDKLVEKFAEEEISPEKLQEVMEFTVDVYVEDDDSINMIELKSVRPNKGEMRGEKLKILLGKAALKYRNPHKKIKYYLGFPFDPFIDKSRETGGDIENFMSKLVEIKTFFSPDEILLASDLWNFLAGENLKKGKTMEELLEIINKIATVDFENIFEYINSYLTFIKDEKGFGSRDFIDEDEFKKMKTKMEEWYLYSEAEALEKINQINKWFGEYRDKIESDKKINSELKRFKKAIYNKMFNNSSGWKYNKDRLEKINKVYSLLEKFLR